MYTHPHTPCANPTPHTMCEPTTPHTPKRKRPNKEDNDLQKRSKPNTNSIRLVDNKDPALDWELTKFMEDVINQLIKLEKPREIGPYWSATDLVSFKKLVSEHLSVITQTIHDSPLDYIEGHSCLFSQIVSYVFKEYTAALGVSHEKLVSDLTNSDNAFTVLHLFGCAIQVQSIQKAENDLLITLDEFFFKRINGYGVDNGVIGGPVVNRFLQEISRIFTNNNRTASNCQACNHLTQRVGITDSEKEEEEELIEGEDSDLYEPTSPSYSPSSPSYTPSSS
jgi:hypothetical protein